MANFNFNKVILGGRLTADPEMKMTASEIPVCSFSLAINRKTAKGSEQKADFINCRAWRNTAEFVSRYFHKGNCICIVGSICNDNYTDKDGNKKNFTYVNVEEANFVDGKNDVPAESGGAAPAANANPYAKAAEDGNFTEVGDDDDLPF